LAEHAVRHQVLGCHPNLVVAFSCDIRAVRKIASRFRCSVCVSLFRFGVYPTCAFVDRGLVGVFLAASGFSGFSGFGWVWRWGGCVHGSGGVIGLNGVLR
jgi:hypothetical protein